jgi:tetratricopeptide (TPR) repeat protein
VASSKKKSKTPPSPTEPVVPSRPSTSTGEILSWCGFTAILIACIGYVLFHAFMIDRVTVRLCGEIDGPNAKPAEVLPVPLLEIAFDGYVWNHHAEKLGENGEWRVRFTDMDNAPYGREVHWSSGFAWYLRGLGEIYRHYTGDTLRNSIYRMSIWANPILLILALTLFATLSARRFGPLCGSVLAIGMITTASFYEGFLPAYPDHHGITAFALMGLIFGIAWAGAGWVQNPEGTAFLPPRSINQARHGMIFSGICGASGLWISGFSAGIVAIGIGIGAITSTAIFSKKSLQTECSYHPELWKLWATVTAGGSLFFYLLEYFPNHLGIRLEVNHPMYGLAWLAGGFAIFYITDWIHHGARDGRSFPWLKVAGCAAVCLMLPTLILVGGSNFYTLLQPFMFGIMNNTAEVLPLMTRIQMGAITWRVAFGLFPIFVVIAIFLMFSRKLDDGSKAILLLLICPIFLITGLQFRQVRWGMLNGPMYISLAGMAVPILWHIYSRRPLQRFGLVAVFCVAGYFFSVDTVRGMLIPFWKQYSSEKNIEVGSGQLLALLHRDMAKALLQNANGKPITVLSSPNSSCLLATFGGLKTIGTLYWENVEGLKTAAEMLNAQSDDEALAMLKKHGITHVSLMTWENFIGPYFQILNPNPVPGKSLENSFGQRALFKKELPRWARPIPYPKNFLSNALQQDVLLLEVVPDQSPEEAEFHLARYQRLAEGNPVAAEIRLKSILDRSPGAAIVRMELATLYLDQKRFDDAKTQVLEAMKDAPPDVRRQNLQNFAQALRQFGATTQADEILKVAGQ